MNFTNMTKRFIVGLLFFPCLTFAAPDFASTNGMTTSCASAPTEAGALKSNTERQVFAVCHDIALLQQIIQWAKQAQQQFEEEEPSTETIRKALREEFTYVRDRLKAVRTVLAGLKLKPDEGLMLKPGSWQVDLDGNGNTETWGSVMNAIPPTSNHSGGVNIAFADGSVRFVKDTINVQTWWAIGSRDGNEIISADAY